MISEFRRTIFSCVLFFFFLVPNSPLFAQEAKPLTHVETVKRKDLDGVNCGVISVDGKYLYSTAWRSNTIGVFKRNQETGKLTHVQSLNSERDLQGTTAVSLSPNGKYTVASAFQSKTMVLLTVDQETGKLRIADVAREGENGVRGLVFAIAAVFSPDTKFIYASDPNAPGLNAGDSGAMTVFRITKAGKFRWVETNTGKENCFAGVRWATPHPTLPLLFSTCNNGNSLVVSERNTTSGKLTVKQVFLDEVDGVTGLAGAMTSDLSPDGKFLYTSSGRFRGDTAIGTYRVTKRGLELIQELFGPGELIGYEGSNAIQVTPDGRNVYAAGTLSRNFVCLARNVKTGELTYWETIDDGSEAAEQRLKKEPRNAEALGIDANDLFGVAAANVVRQFPNGAAGIAISPDSRFIYVMVEDAAVIQVYRRPDPEVDNEPRNEVAEEKATTNRRNDDEAL